MILSFRFSLTVIICVLLTGCSLLTKKEVIFQGTSMLPSIKDGQKLTTRRIDAAVRASLARGDILAFKYPEDPSKFYIKRLIGMPGERIEIQAGQVG
jgi:signal peptidase I